MTLKFQILGLELARIELDIEQRHEPIVETVVGKGVQTMSRWWVGRMFGR